MDTRLPRGGRSRPSASNFSPAIIGSSLDNTSSFSSTLPSTIARGKRATVPNLAPDLSTSNLSPAQIEGLRRQSNLSTLSLSPRRPSSVGGVSGSTNTTRPRRPSAFNGGGDPDESFLESELGNLEGAEEVEWTMVERMRNWRNDAMTQHLYGTAEFWGSKVFGMTGDPNDAFWLAQTHFFTHQYGQAEKILTTLRVSSDSSSAPTASSSTPKRLTDSSLACRYLAAQCLVRLGRWEEALELVGRGSFLENGSEEQEPEDFGVKLTSSISHLRGLIHLHMGASDLAKEAFMQALSRDVKCFESFEVLVGGEMMTTEEEWAFIQGLQYQAQTGPDADFVRMMYTVRLKKIKHHDEVSVARQRLTEEYGLGDDPDVLFGRADELYAGMHFAECYKITSRILGVHSSHRPTLPLHLSCMHHLPHLRSRLFLLAHELVDNEPDDAVSWYAVGLWYFSGRRWEESRRYFGKSVLIDSRFGPSWVAFAHSYAFEGEHDQAITAYSTALRHFQGTHLPLLFIGMQHVGLANSELAREYLDAARIGCPDDPLVTNELGVVAMMDGRYDDAVELFKATLALAVNLQSSKAAWATTHLNLGHAYRKLLRLDEAHACFRRVLKLNSRSAGAYSALGIVEHLLGRYQESIARYHEALSISPGDPVTCELLRLVLEDVDKAVSTNKFPFPGLPLSSVRSIDAQVRELDEDILLGRPLKEREIPSSRDRLDESKITVDFGKDETIEEEDMPLDEGEEQVDDTEQTMDTSG